MIWNDENATLAGRATSGLQNVNFTVLASTASSLARLPAYSGVPHLALSSYFKSSDGAAAVVVAPPAAVVVAPPPLAVVVAPPPAVVVAPDSLLSLPQAAAKSPSNTTAAS